MDRQIWVQERNWVEISREKKKIAIMPIPKDIADSEIWDWKLYIGQNRKQGTFSWKGEN